MPPRLQVVEGDRSGNEQIVFSLHHPIQRIDVMARDVVQIAAHEWQFFPGVDRGFRLPHVEITLASEVRARIYRLTKALSDPRLGGAVLKLIVAGKCIREPEIHEAIGHVPGFLLSAGSLEEAEELAATLNAHR